MKITVQQLVDEAKQERVTLAEMYFVPDDVAPAMLTFENSSKLSNGKAIQLKAGYARGNKNFSLVVVFEGSHVFSAMGHWGEVAPYFAFRLPDQSFIELYGET